MDLTHSIIITFESKTAVVWYPDNPRYVHHHRIEDGHLYHEPPYNIVNHGRDLGAMEFITHYAEGTNG